MSLTNKLVSSYSAAVKLSEKYESKHWVIINQPKRDYFFQSLNDDFSKIENFRSNKFLSEGLDDAVDRKFIPDVFFKLGEMHGFEKILQYMQSKNIGNSEHSIKIFEKYTDYNELFHIDMAIKLDEHIFSKLSYPIVCEIGGGYGSLARMILSKNKCKYILIDLPEANILSSYYLDQHFSSHGKNILHFCDLNQDTLSLDDIHDFDIIILPPHVRFHENLKIDLFINSRSMMEMTKNVIKEYFELIHNNIHEMGYFLNINRYIKTTVGEKIMISRYPYDDNWKVKISEKAFLQDHIHFLLAQRNFSDISDISIELSNLEIEAKKYFESTFSKYFRKLLNNLKLIIPANIKNKIRLVLFQNNPE